jgi:hypothetical protein
MLLNMNCFTKSQTINLLGSFFPFMPGPHGDIMHQLSSSCDFRAEPLNLTHLFIHVGMVYTKGLRNLQGIGLLSFSGPMSCVCRSETVGGASLQQRL